MQVYLHPHQMAHCLRDVDIMTMVHKAQLKLVYLEGFPELFTWCRNVTVKDSLNSSFPAEEEVGCATALRSPTSGATAACW